MRRELAGERPTQLVAMVVQRVVMTWLALQHTEMRFFASQQENIAWAKYWLRLARPL
jgi:hypothetical protein